MMRLTSLRLVRNAGRVVLLKQARPALSQCLDKTTTTTQKRNLHLPPLHKRFIHGRPRRLLHSPTTEESNNSDLFESDFDDSTQEPKRTFKIMSAGVHHTTDTPSEQVWYDEDYDKDNLHMTTAHSRADHEQVLGQEQLQHDDVLTVSESRRQWDSDHYYASEENSPTSEDPLSQYEGYPFNDFDPSSSGEEEYEYEMEEDWEIGREEVEAVVNPNEEGFVPEFDNV